ncbi:uncharacterized protein [Lepeophtheirus salmonis]|uniref:uncharacterized protein isoform X2 n=1 Tax=Lepeophtheirus salmonis TaxID=72036 RepID=UPI003AF3AE83
MFLLLRYINGVYALSWMHSTHKVSSTFIIMDFSSIFPIFFLLVCVLWNKEVKGNPIVSCPTVDGETCVFPFVYDGETYDHCHFNDSHYLCATSQSNSTHPATSLSTCSVTCFGDAAMLERFHSKFVTTNVVRALDDGPEECLTKGSEKCIFPYTINGVMHNNCTYHSYNGKDSYLCPISVQENLEAEGLTNCSKDCIEAQQRKEKEKKKEDKTKDSEEDKEESKCKTLSEINCVFPFKFNGIEHTSCTYEGIGHYSWCATAVDPSTMEYTSYGFCSKDCEKEEKVPEDQCASIYGKKCVFPFLHKEQTYNECTGTDNEGLPWCATKVNEYMEYLEYEICRSIC